jgi:hypothetical protein
MSNDTIKIIIDHDYQNCRYMGYHGEESFYSSPEYHEAYNRYRKHRGMSASFRNNREVDLLEMLATAPFKAGFSALDVLLRVHIDRNVIKVLDDAIRGYRGFM